MIKNQTVKTDSQMNWVLQSLNRNFAKMINILRKTDEKIMKT